MKRHILLLFHLTVAAILLAGCSRTPRPEDLPSLYPTVLTVTQEGKPLADALVSLFSEDPRFKWGVAAITDTSGTATIMTHGRFPGAPEGRYKIVVMKIESSDGNDQSPAGPDETVPDQAERPKTRTLYYLVERPYTGIDTTPLSVEIKKGKNVETMDVGKAVRETGEIIEL